MARRKPLKKSEGRQTQSRKKDHVDIILKGGTRAVHNAWDDVHLVHEALPELDLDSIGLETTFLGARLKAPLMVASMTGGYPDAERINGNLAAAASEAGVALGVGSQRAALLKPETRRSFSVVRDHDVPFVAANIGAPQLIPQGKKPALSLADVKDVVAMVEADALIVHLNFLQETVQPEGDRAGTGVLDAIARLCRDLDVPVIAKETGAGISRATSERLKRAGVAAIDVGGLSGTTFAAVELERAKKAGESELARLGETFRDWGIPTPVAVKECQVGLPLVATGGIRHGLDAARALSLGADLAGLASAALTPANKSAKAAAEFLARATSELQAACLLTGSPHVRALREHPPVLTGRTRDWIASRDL